MTRLPARPFLALLAALLALGPATAQVDAPIATPLDEPTDAAGCDVASTPALTVVGVAHWGQTYIDLTVPMPGGSIDFYVENNAVAGLQRDPTRCEDGREIPADLCVSRYGTSLSYCARQLPWTLTP